MLILDEFIWKKHKFQILKELKIKIICIHFYNDINLF